MQLTTVIVTRNVSISVKTLHTLLKLNIVCLQKNIANELVFVRDDPFEKYDILMKKLKHCDRILWIDYSLFVDEASILKMLGDFPKGCEVFAARKRNVAESTSAAGTTRWLHRVSQKVSTGTCSKRRSVKVPQNHIVRWDSSSTLRSQTRLKKTSTL